ncbi:hypothetical protein ATANTOWER_024546 [Ataeniobius toweri]|uniref:Uncharacterized protein n=1 Tax=Ataeniobius toweri TaxID=208326 RepID=A0ABU7AQV2_9TELE|nr:hypothetical protein [Ataeniobius toweri]
MRSLAGGTHPGPTAPTTTPHRNHCNDHSPGRNTKQVSSTVTAQPIQIPVTAHPKRGYNHPTTHDAPPPQPHSGPLLPLHDSQQSSTPPRARATEGSIGGRPPQLTKDRTPTPHLNPRGAPTCRPHTLPYGTPRRATPPTTLLKGKMPVQQVEGRHGKTTACNAKRLHPTKTQNHQN